MTKLHGMFLSANIEQALVWTQVRPTLRSGDDIKPELSELPHCHLKRPRNFKSGLLRMIAQSLVHLMSSFVSGMHIASLHVLQTDSPQRELNQATGMLGYFCGIAYSERDTVSSALSRLLNETCG
jgi:hypothetical protein